MTTIPWKITCCFDTALKMRLSAGHKLTRTESQPHLLPNLRNSMFIVLLLVLTYSGFASALDTEALNKQSVPTQSSRESNPWSPIKPYVAKYDFLLDDDKLGQATRALTIKNNHWKLETLAKAKKFIMSMKSNDTTEFHIDDQQLVNDSFSSYSKVTFKKAKTINQVFDWDKKLETGSRNKKNWAIPLVNQVFDRVSHLIQLRVDLLQGLKSFDYPVSHKGKIHRYIYTREKKEVIETSFGKVNADKFVREKSGDEIFIIWLAPDLDYFPIKISQYKVDKPRVSLLLNSLDILQQGNSSHGTTLNSN